MKQANKIIFDFIWKGKDKVKRSTLVSEIEDGGLKAPHLESIIETQRVLCCKKLASDQPSTWKTILLHYLKPVGGKLILCCNFELQKLPIRLPKFYDECFRSFAKCSGANRGSVQGLNGNDLAKIILWNNKFICIGGNSVYFKTLAEKGIIKIEDLISDNNELIVKNNHRLRELNILPLDAFRLLALIDALPLEWREGLKTISHIENEPFNIHDEIKLNLNEQTIPIKTAASKIVYKELRNRTITPPTAQLKFNTKFVDDVLEWKEIYSLPFRATLDTKSREFQYKLLNRCLVTNAFLFKVGLASTAACSFCGDMDESLEHIITSCHYSKNFWAEVIKWFDKQGIAMAYLSDKDIMLGIVRCDDELFVNHVILVAKQYLYYCRQKRFLPSIRVLDLKIKMIYQLETIIAKSNNKISAHNKKWGKYKVQ